MVLALGVALVFAALFLGFAAVGGLTRERAGVARSLEVLDALTTAPPEMQAELDPTFHDRVVSPLLGWTQRLGRRLTPADANERIRAALERAGSPSGWTVERVVAGRVIGLVLGLVVSAVLLMVLGVSLPVLVGLVAIAAVVGYHAPSLYLYQRSYDRNGAIQNALPDAIDLLTISVESGLAFDGAVAQVARNTEGPLAEEFARMLQEMQIGRSRSDALRSMAERTAIPDLRSFAGAMVQADSFGIPVGQVLRVQSSEIRVKRRQRAEEQAQKVPIKIMPPLIFCILPCLFLVVLGPAAISMMDSFSGTM